MLRPSSTAATATAVAGLLLSLLAHGAAQRTFVASTGVDTNPCSIGAPCRSFTQAALQTSANGEIIVLDSAGYGPVAITQSLSILAPAGIYAGISVLAAANGVVITGATIQVVLRGLTINGQGGDFGIVINDSAYVHIENVIISGMANSGILVNGASRVFVNDTLVRNNGGKGLEIVPLAGGLAQVSVDRLRSEANQSDGIYVDNNVRLNVRDSVITRNFASGVNVNPDVGETISVGIDNTALTNNLDYGVVAQGTGGGAVVVGGSAIKDNGTGGLARIAPTLVVYTRQNNTIVQNNGSDVIGELTPLGGM